MRLLKWLNGFLVFLFFIFLVPILTFGRIENPRSARGGVGIFQFFSFSVPIVQAAECKWRDCGTIEECERRIKECEEIIGLYESATGKNTEDLLALEKEVKKIKGMITSASAQISDLEKDIFSKGVDLAYQEEVLAARVRSYYIKSQKYSPLLIFFSSSSVSELTRELSYRLSLADEDRRIIVEISKELIRLSDDKEKLEQSKSWLAKKKVQIDERAEFLRKEIGKAEEYIGELKGAVAALTSKQQAILAARTGTFTSSVGEVPVSRIPCSGPPGSPTYCDPGGGNWFGAFSFGAWTHRKGMSQYGAKGRAETGQNFEQILQAYYGRTSVAKDTGGTISVSGHGNLDFENDYLLGIAEMPSSWHPEALKAQAVAARSYAYRYKQEGRAICATQSCQVFSRSKADNPPAEWRAAVEETRGKIIEETIAFYSSTAGGYLTTSGWDTTDGQGGPGFASRAWESKAGSPWFYSSWFTQSYTSGSAKCGRSHPWLTEEEMADILNTWLVLDKQGGDERILPVTINQCPIGGTSGNPYSISELRDKADSLGGAFTSVASASVVYGSNGETNSLGFSTNKGSVNISGSEFKRAFNLRAPGYIAIRSSLFNVEKK